MQANCPRLVRSLLALLALMALLALGSCGATSGHVGVLNVSLPGRTIGGSLPTSGFAQLSSKNFFPKNDNIQVYFDHVLSAPNTFVNIGPFNGKSDDNGTLVLIVDYTCTDINMVVPINYRAPMVSIKAVSTDQNYTASNAEPVNDFCISNSAVPTNFSEQ